MNYCSNCGTDYAPFISKCPGCGSVLGQNGDHPHNRESESPERVHSVTSRPDVTERYSVLRTGGGAILLFGIVFGLYALNMDTSVETGLGRVNNIGLLNDQQNYVIIAGIATIAGLIMILMGGRQANRSALEKNSLSASIDPFDALDIEKANDRKRYAISLGVSREDGTFKFANESYDDLEKAIVAAEQRL